MPKTKIINWKNISAVILMLAVMLAACQPKSTPTESPPPTESEGAATEAATEAPTETESPQETAPVGEMPADLVKRVWVLIGYGDANNPMVVEPGIRVTANFNVDGTVSGSSGCNSYNSSFKIDGESISFGQAAVTMMACETGMDQEAAYLAALETAKKYQIIDNERLLIDYDGGTGSATQLVFSAEKALVNTLWVLTSYGDPNDPTPSQPGVITTAKFKEDGTVNGSAGCNQFSASYSQQGDEISIGLPSVAIMGCESGLEQEQAFLSALELAESLRISEGYLEITYAGGAAILRFSARHMPLENVRWMLSSIDGQPLPAEVEAYAVFTPAGHPANPGNDNLLNGKAACNGFFGAYSVQGKSLSAPGPLGVTQMQCPDEVMQIEKAFLGGLETAQSYETFLNQLTIPSSNGTLVFFADLAPLEGPVWKLPSIGPIDSPQTPVPQANFTAAFTRPVGMPSGILAGTTGCNDYSSAYTASLDEIKVNFPERTGNVCPPDLAEQEQTYFKALHDARIYRILGNELQIFFDSQMLKFEATYPPAQGGDGPLSLLDGTKWWLISADSFGVIPNSEITADFAINPDELSGQISGSAGCNMYSGEITGVFQVGPLNVTQSICETPTGVMEQENAFLAVLDSAISFTLDGNQLLINTGLVALVYTNQGPGAVQPLPPTETPEAVQPLPSPETPVAMISAPDEGQVDQRSEIG